MLGDDPAALPLSPPSVTAVPWDGAPGCVCDIIPQELRALRVPLTITLGTGPGSPPGHQSPSVCCQSGWDDVTLPPKQEPQESRGFHDPLVSPWKSVCSLQNISHGHLGGSQLEKWHGTASLWVPASTEGSEMGQSHAPGWESAPSEAPAFPGLGVLGSVLDYQIHGIGWVGRDL